MCVCVCLSVCVYLCLFGAFVGLVLVHRRYSLRWLLGSNICCCFYLALLADNKMDTSKRNSRKRSGASLSLRESHNVYIVSVGQEKIPKSGETKHRYYDIYVQDSTRDQLRIGGFNFRLKAQLEQYAASKVPVSLMWSDSCRGLTFDNICTVAPLQSTGFPYREVIPLSRAAEVQPISDVMNALDYKSFVTIEATVTFGEDEMEVIQTYSGLSKCKKDCFVEDLGGISRIDIWESVFVQLKNKQKYRFSRIRLKNFESQDFLTTSTYSKVTELPNDILDSDLKGPARCLAISVTKELDVPKFITIRKFKILFTCPACDGAIELATPVVPETVTCTDDACGAMTQAEDMTVDYTIECLFMADGERVWGLMDTNVLEKLVGKVDVSNLNIVRDQLVKLTNIALQFNSKTLKIVSASVEEDKIVSASVEEDKGEEEELNAKMERKID